MCIFEVTTPMRRKPIGKMHATLGAALKAAARAAKRLDQHVEVKHWRDGKRAIVFTDGTVLHTHVMMDGTTRRQIKGAEHIIGATVAERTP